MRWVWLALWLSGCAGGSPDGTLPEDRDGDGAAAGYDCDDADPLRNPFRPELCNGIDDDCSGTADENPVDAARWFADADRDGHGDPRQSELDCTQPEGSLATGDDCDDADASIHPGADERCDGKDQDCNGSIDDDVAERTYWRDGDGDGSGDPADPITACAPPPGYVGNSDDCDDDDDAVNPNAAEADCDDPRDYDCDGFGAPDADADGYYGCDDCDDTRADVHPDAAEVCDALDADEDCDGKADDKDIGPSGRILYYTDLDGDGWGVGVGVLRCDGDSSRPASIAGDCDDADAGTNPAAIEVCDEADIDEDCDGFADDTDGAATGTAWFYADTDGDGWGTGTGSKRCDPSSAWLTTVSGDCDDGDARRSPGLSEVCDGVDLDEDCDDLADDNDSSVAGTSTFYVDDDDDGYGALPSVSRCDASAGFPADNDDDCDDDSDVVSPAAAETAGDDIDQDCDGSDLDAITYAEVRDPCAATVDEGDALTVEGQVYAPGFTDSTGPAALRAEAGWGDVAVDPSGWTWTTGSWARDATGTSTGSDDVWTADITPSFGDWGLLWRFSNDGGRSFTYGDLGAACAGAGSDDGVAEPVAVSVVAADDRDGDGYGTDDCDDADADVHPGADEAYGDGVDNDCDGGIDETVALSTLTSGALVISEILYDPAAVADADGEWFEIYNPSSAAVDLDGLLVESNKGAGTESFTVSGTVVVDAGAYVVLGRNSDVATNGGATVSYAWGSSGSAMALSNSGDAIRLYNGSTLLDAVTYGSSSPWPTAGGKALELSGATLDATSNDDVTSWCAATATFGSGDKGSPGGAPSGC